MDFTIFVDWAKNLAEAFLWIGGTAALASLAVVGIKLLAAGVVSMTKALDK